MVILAKKQMRSTLAKQLCDYVFYMTMCFLERELIQV